MTSNLHHGQPRWTKPDPSLPNDYRSLRTWQVAMQLAELVYRLTDGLPDSERFGMASQLRRAAISIPANVAEGNGRMHRREYLHHLSIARGSAHEVATLVELSHRLGWVPAEMKPELDEHLDHTCRCLKKLSDSLKVPPK